MALITCGNFSFLFILPIIASALNIINYELFPYSGYIYHPIISNIISNTFLSLFFIPFLFRKFVCNRKSEEKNEYKLTLKFEINYPLIFTIILGFIYEISNLFHILFGLKIYNEKELYRNDYLIEFFFVYTTYKLFSYILRYKHHIISILFILFFGLLYYAIEVAFYKISFYIIFIIFKQIFVGFCLVFIENLMKAGKFTLFKVIFIFGIVGLIVDLFILMITSNVKCAESLKGNLCSSSEKYFKNNNENNNWDYFLDNANIFYNYFNFKRDNDGTRFIICTIIFSLCASFGTFFNFLIVSKSNPDKVYFSNIIISLYLKIRELFYESRGEIYIIIVQIIIIIIILFWAFVYNEIIQLNFCGMSDDTVTGRLNRNDLDKKRTSTWVNNTILGDADVTLVDKSNINIVKKI